MSQMVLQESIRCARTSNSIRRIVDRVKPSQSITKPIIQLSIGDPTVFGQLGPPEFIHNVINSNLTSGKFNGYPHSCGYPRTREAVAEFESRRALHRITGDDVFMTSGCSQALELSFNAIANPGNEILIPNPGFSLYKCICNSYGLNAVTYNLDSSNHWQIDLDDLERKISPKTKAVVINNPSNPCGSSFSKSHMRDIITALSNKNIPIISDEIYADMVFQDKFFCGFSDIHSDVPIIQTSGLAKRFMVPGWRIGWIALHDRNNQLSTIRKGLLELTTVTLGPASVFQSVVPELLFDTPASYHTDNINFLEKNFNVINDTLAVNSHLEVMPSEGTMYSMIKLKAGGDDVDFATKLLNKEGVFVLPGSVFGANGFFRLVTASCTSELQEACERLNLFFR